jgi:glycosyltransferase involved in cell wall biosynthesis
MCEHKQAAKDEPRVSCVMTVFNGEAYIAQAIESVLAQSYTNWELIIVDDGSNDATRSIAERYQADHPAQLKVLRHPDGQNHGKSVSRNVGVEASSGSIIALLDADDIWLPDKLAIQIEILRRHPDVEFTYGPVLYHYAWTRRPQDQPKDSPSPLGVRPNRVIAPPHLLTKMLLAEARRSECIFPYPSSVAFRRGLFDRAGGFEADFTRLYDDAIFFAKALAVAKAFPTNAVLAKYRLHAGAMLSYSYEEAIASGDGRSEMDRAGQRFLERTQEFLKAHRIRDLRLKGAMIRTALAYRNPGADRLIRRLAKVRRRTRTRLKKLGRSLLQRQDLAIPVPAGQVRWGDLGVAPLCRPALVNGRGGSITDRHFDRCIRRFSEDIAGDTAEIGDDVYLRRYRSANLRSSTVVESDSFGQSEATDQFDCLIAQDVLRFSENPGITLQAMASRLKPGGVLLTSLTAIAPIIPGASDRWRYTEDGARLLFEASGCLCLTDLDIMGGLRTATAVLHGLGVDDLGTVEERGASDIPVNIFVRAVKT